MRDWMHMEHGVERRRAIVAYIATQSPLGRTPVNKRYCIQVNDDPDVKKLIKTGILKLERRNEGGFMSRPYHSVTYLTLALKT